MMLRRLKSRLASQNVITNIMPTSSKSIGRTLSGMISGPPSRCLLSTARHLAYVNTGSTTTTSIVSLNRRITKLLSVPQVDLAVALMSTTPDKTSNTDVTPSTSSPLSLSTNPSFQDGMDRTTPSHMLPEGSRSSLRENSNAIGHNISGSEEKDISPKVTPLSSSSSLSTKQQRAAYLRGCLDSDRRALKSIDSKIQALLEEPSLSQDKPDITLKMLKSSIDEQSSTRDRITQMETELSEIEQSIKVEEDKLMSEDERRDQSDSLNAPFMSEPNAQFLRNLMKCVTTKGMGFYARIVNSDTEYTSPYDDDDELLPREELEKMGYVYIDGKTETLPIIRTKTPPIIRTKTLPMIRTFKPDRNFRYYFHVRGLFLDFLQQFIDDPDFKRDPDAMIEIRLPFDLTTSDTTYFGSIPVHEPLFIRKRDWELISPYLMYHGPYDIRDNLAIFGHPGIGKSAFLNFLLILSLRAGYTVKVEKWTGKHAKEAYVLNPHSQQISYYNNVTDCDNARAHISLEDPGNANIKPLETTCFKVFATSPNRAFFENPLKTIFANRIPIAVPENSQLVTMMHLAKGKSRKEIWAAVQFLSPSLRYLSQALGEMHNYRHPGEHIAGHIIECKQLMKAMVDNWSVERIVDIFHKIVKFSNKFTYYTFPQLSIGTSVQQNESPEVQAIANNVYPRFLFTGHPGYVVRSEDLDSKYQLFIGRGNPIIGEEMLDMIKTDFKNQMTSRILQQINECRASFGGKAYETKLLRDIQSGQGMLLQYVFGKRRSVLKELLETKDENGNDVQEEIRATANELPDITLFEGEGGFPKLYDSVLLRTLKESPGGAKKLNEKIIVLGESYYFELVFIIEHKDGHNYFLILPPFTGTGDSHPNLDMVLVIKCEPDDTLSNSALPVPALPVPASAEPPFQPNLALGLKLIGIQVTASKKHDFNSTLQAYTLAYVTYRLSKPLEPKLDAKFKDYSIVCHEIVEKYKGLSMEGDIRLNHSARERLGIDAEEEEILGKYRASLWKWMQERLDVTVYPDGGVLDWNTASANALPFYLCACTKTKELEWHVVRKDRSDSKTVTTHIPYYHVPLNERYLEDMVRVKNLTTKWNEIVAGIYKEESDIKRNIIDISDSSTKMKSNLTSSDTTKSKHKRENE